MLVDADADVDARTANGEPLLYEAIRRGFVDVVRVLVDADADVDARTAGGSTLLHEAERRRFTDIVAILAGTGSVPLGQITERDRLIAKQEALLNVYRCLFNVDVQVVPGGCSNGKPTRPAAQPDSFTGTPTAAEVDRREKLVAKQEALLNVYRCLFNVDTQVVPGGCPSGQSNGQDPSSPGTPSASTDDQELEFLDDDPATRSITENAPAGIHVGDPVSSSAQGTLTYSLGGPDAASFTIVPTTGQVVTSEGVHYDYETKSRYEVNVEVADGRGGKGSIEVVINVDDLVPAREQIRNVRTNHGDGYVVVKWTPVLPEEGEARVLGYEIEIRRGLNGPWTGRRTVLGGNIGSTIYEDLTNREDYWFRVRPISAEGDRGWSSPVEGFPIDVPTPRYARDRFGTDPVGTPEHNWRLLTQGRCRYTEGGVTADANCRYQNTSPNTSSITLEFDDPSLGSCDVRLAFSSLTAGSFTDECFGAGVNTEVPFDRGFRMPPSGTQTASEVEIPRAPRSQEEFEAFTWGRDDFIPGLFFGCPPVFLKCGFTPGQAYRVGRDPSTGLPHYTEGKFAYRNSGSSQGVLGFKAIDGQTHLFILDFDPSGTVRMTITDGEGEATAWPGMPDLDLTLGANPVLLPIPPSWSAAIAIEKDFAPELPAIDSARETFIVNALAVPLLDRVVESHVRNSYGGGLNFSRNYLTLGRNRAVLTVQFPARNPQRFDNLEEPLKTLVKALNGSTYSFDITFTADGAAEYTLTISKEGHAPTVEHGFADFNGNSINLEQFPEELLLPAAPPQATGQDRSGIGVAAAISAAQISGSDVQTFLIDNQGAQPIAYQPGDWLEPKDGSNQRMMIVGAGSVSSASTHSARQLGNVGATPDPSSFGVSATNYELGATVDQRLLARPTLTQLRVVCMQAGYNIPTRGARYFSQPKTAQDAIQVCQHDCVLNGDTTIQECVWKCERES